MGGIHAVEHAALALFPLFALCDRLDVAGISIARHPQVAAPAIFLYDAHPGGIGSRARASSTALEALLEPTARARRASATASDGCPSLRPLAALRQRQPPDRQARGAPGARPRCSRASRSRLRRGALRARARLPAGRRRRSPRWTRPRASRRSSSTSRRSARASEVGGWHNAHLMRLALAVVFDAATGASRPTARRASTRCVARLFAARPRGRLQRAPLRLPRAARLQPTATFAACRPSTCSTRSTDASASGSRSTTWRPETLGRAKSGDGLQSLVWWKEGRIDEIESYCREDVELLRDLFELRRAREARDLPRKDGERVRLPVDWDEPAILARIAERREKRV